MPQATLLVVTQKVDRNDPVLGFFHRWLAEFAKHFFKVVVIAGFAGDYDLPNQIEVHSLGKEKGMPKWKRVLKFEELFSFHYARCDAVFFHMSPEFVLAASPFLLSLPKISALWYIHKHAGWRLQLAERMVDYIFTAAEASFPLLSKKVIFTGHAIDTDFFKPLPGGDHAGGRVLRMLSVGRISPVKGFETIIRAGALLKGKNTKSWSMTIVGAPISSRDQSYFSSLKNLISENRLEREIIFEGSRPYQEMPLIYQNHDLFISLTPTGSFDKAVLEAMSSGLAVLAASRAFEELLPRQYLLEHVSPEFLAERMEMLAFEIRPNLKLRELVINNHALSPTIREIAAQLRVKP